VSAELRAGCLNLGMRGRGGVEGNGGRNRRMKHKIRGERGRKRTKKDGQE